MRLVYDLECNGLNPDTIWCIVALDIDTQQIYKFSDHDNLHGRIIDGIHFLSNAELLIGHNIIGFDNQIIERLYGYNLSDHRIHDSYIMSQVLRYKRSHRHGLNGWGKHLGNEKMSFDMWDTYSREMLHYCVQDVRVNADVYKTLLDEYKTIYNKNPLIKEGLKIEHDTAIFNAKVKTKGWKLDVNRARETLERMRERMEKIENTIEPQLGERVIWIDKDDKYPKYKKNGDYTATTARLLGEYYNRDVQVHDVEVHEAGMAFRRSRTEPIRLGSMDLVKDWLLENGWKPDEYQKKKVGFEWITTSPKLTSTSLQKMGERGQLIDEYYTLRNRNSVVSGWLEAAVDGRLHGNMWTIGTPTFRCRHEVIVNLPAASAAWGTELRELLIADDDCVLVGADSSGNQLRGLCHYVGNKDFTHEVCFGDQHQRNADILNCDRPTAKSYLYAYLFGAGDGKLGQVLTGKNNPSKGRQSKETFAKGIRGLGELRQRLGKAWKKTYYQQSDGWFNALDGRPTFCGGEHQTLNYLLQSAEAITCKAALSYTEAKIKEEGLRAEPRLFYHDELCYNVHKDDAERVGEIMQDAFKEAPKTFKVDCMDGGDYMIGDNYAQIH